jgi:hypothetical protein
MYRLVAKTLAEIVGFDEIDIADFKDEDRPLPAQPQTIGTDKSDKHEFRLSIGSDIADNSNLSSARNSFDTSNNINTGLNHPLASASSDSLHSKDSSVSYQEFLWKMGMMQKQKTWIESVRRRYASYAHDDMPTYTVTVTS